LFVANDKRDVYLLVVKHDVGKPEFVGGNA